MTTNINNNKALLKNIWFDDKCFFSNLNKRIFRQTTVDIETIEILMYLSKSIPKIRKKSMGCYFTKYLVICTYIVYQ